MEKDVLPLASASAPGFMTWHIAESEPHRGVEQLVARRAHNPKVVGSSPTPATTSKDKKGLVHEVCWPFCISNA